MTWHSSFNNKISNLKKNASTANFQSATVFTPLQSVSFYFYDYTTKFMCVVWCGTLCLHQMHLFYCVYTQFNGFVDASFFKRKLNDFLSLSLSFSVYIRFFFYFEYTTFLYALREYILPIDVYRKYSFECCLLYAKQ